MNECAVVHTYMESPLGRLYLARNDHGLTHILFGEGGPPEGAFVDWRRDAGVFRDAVDQLTAYFRGELPDFNLPLAPVGTPIQRRVWEALRAIPCGDTSTYGAIARRLGLPSAARAVGAANGRNPLAIVVPCHRVIGSTGALTGYAGGIGIKGALLEHERRYFSRANQQMLLP